VAGNLIAVLAANYGMLILARVVTGALHGLFIGVAFAVAAAVVPPSAWGAPSPSSSAASPSPPALGVPLGTLIGQSLGWRATFLTTSIVGCRSY